MSEENLEIVRRWIDAFNRGGVEEAIRFLDPEIEWTTTSAFLQAGTYEGHAGVRQFVRRATAEWEDLHVEPENLVDAADQVVVPLRITARVRQSGSPGVLKLVVLASLQGGVIVRVRSYMNTARALKAAGVSEDTSAMLDENVGVVRLGYERMSSGDIDGFLQLCAGDFEFSDLPELPGSDVVVGHDAFRAWWAELVDDFEDLRFEAEELIDAGGNRVLAVTRAIGRGRGSRSDVALHSATVWRLSHGKLVSYVAYSDRTKALEAAGLGEFQ
jgi:uncharacterized protein